MISHEEFKPVQSSGLTHSHQWDVNQARQLPVQNHQGEIWSQTWWGPAWSSLLCCMLPHTLWPSSYTAAKEDEANKHTQKQLCFSWTLRRKLWRQRRDLQDLAVSLFLSPFFLGLFAFSDSKPPRKQKKRYRDLVKMT